MTLLTILGTIVKNTILYRNLNEEEDDGIEMNPREANVKEEQDLTGLFDALCHELNHEPHMDTDAACSESSSDEHQGEETDAEQGTEDPKESTERVEVHSNQNPAEIKEENQNDDIEVIQ